MTFVHEVWLLLQHANILLNPLCQRLDRSYGVALVSVQIKVGAPDLVLFVSKHKSRGFGWCLRRWCIRGDKQETSTLQRVLAQGRSQTSIIRGG